MKTLTALSILLFALTSVGACSDSGSTACAEVAHAQAQLSGGQCVGSAKSCSSIGISTSQGQKACAYQDGCELSYDYNDCRGSATRCSELSKVYCGHQLGCTWKEEGSSAGGSSGNDPTSGTPCAAGAGAIGAPGNTSYDGGSPTEPDGGPVSTEDPPPAPPSR